MKRYDNLRAMSHAWIEDRPTMKANNTVPKLLELLQAEVTEAIEATSEELPQELADIGIFLFSIFEALGLDLYDEVAEKNAFNMLRYHWQDFQEGDYDEGRKKAKAREGDIKREFYKD